MEKRKLKKVKSVKAKEKFSKKITFAASPELKRKKIKMMTKLAQ